MEWSNFKNGLLRKILDKDTRGYAVNTRKKTVLFLTTSVLLILLFFIAIRTGSIDTVSYTHLRAHET